jgi:ribosomal protein S27E
LLASVYERLKPWMPNHPDLNVYKAYQDKVGCPTCTSTNTQRRGTQVKLKSKFYRYQCQDCGSWFPGMKVFGKLGAMGRGFGHLGALGTVIVHDAGRCWATRLVRSDGQP